MTLATAAGACLLLCGANARAEPAPPAVQTAVPASPEAPASPTPAPARAERQALSPTSAASVDAPRMTPWPWPFPWMRDARTRDTEVSTPEASAARDVTQSRSPAGARRRSGAPAAAAAAATVAQEPATGESQPVAPPPSESDGRSRLPLPVTALLGAGAPSANGTCTPEAIQNGVTSDRGAIVQVAVRNSDCTWGAAQTLVSYDERGPPTVDVLTQSAGVSVDVGVVVAEDKLNLRFGWAGPDGALTYAAPVVLDPIVQAHQTGDNRVVVEQDADVASGDAVSGSQKISVSVEGDAAAIHVLAQNASPNAAAASGDAVSGNVAGGEAGPVASGAADVQSGQAGDNDVGIGQRARSRSGNATAGSQAIDVNVTGSVGEVGILASNVSPHAVAVSGNALSSNLGTAKAGPSAIGTGHAAAGQVGENRIGIGQSAEATTGDAVAGSQVIGVSVGGNVGHLSVLATNGADGSFARSGNAAATNVAGVQAGPLAVGVGGAMSAQVGRNVVVVDQTATATTGDAIAGSQVIGVSVGGEIGTGAVMTSNDADFTLATSGTATAVNAAAGTVGASAVSVTPAGDAQSQQFGDNVVGVSQTADMTSGDALSASGTVLLASDGAPRGEAATQVVPAAAQEPVGLLVS